MKARKTVKIIKEGGVVAVPTDTVFGLLADAENEKAVKKVFRIKKRSFSKPIPLFVKSISQAKKYAFINKEQEEFLKEKWPGQTTVILKAKENNLAELLFKGTENIGFRIPDSKRIQKILKKIENPLTATSANISGEPPARNKKEVEKYFENEEYRPDLVLEGKCFNTNPSTVIDYTKKERKVIRE